MRDALNHPLHLTTAAFRFFTVHQPPRQVNVAFSEEEGGA
jgi:hypothetical protein